MGGGCVEILLAANAGFCVGVRRALKLVLEAANSGAYPRPIVTVGPLIHNAQVLQVLASRGVGTLEEGADCHVGTAVRKVQQIAQKCSSEGYNCIIVGDPGHAEVEAVLGHTGGRGVVVSGLEDIERLPPMDRVAVVAQTTQDVETFQQVAARLREKYPGCEVFDTICRATHRRQAEAERLARQVDAMVVVGDRNSANTRRLAELCRRTGCATYHVQGPEELDVDGLLGCRRIGVTAGASTPHWTIRRVLTAIRSEDQRRRRALAYMLRRTLAVPVRTNLLVGGGAAAMTYAASVLIGQPNPRLRSCMVLALCFITAQHLLNQYGKRETMYLNEPARGAFFRKHARGLILLAGACAVVALGVAAALGPLPFALILAGTGGGLLYALPSGGRSRAGIPLRLLQRLPGSKELFVGLAWAVSTAAVPALAAGAAAPGAWRGGVVAAMLAFLLAFHRTLFTDLSDIEGDQILGRESLALVLGERRCKNLMVLVLFAEAALLLWAAGAGWTGPAGYLLLGVVAYSALCFARFQRRHMPEAELGEALIDAKFYLCGLLAGVATML